MDISQYWACILQSISATSLGVGEKGQEANDDESQVKVFTKRETIQMKNLIAFPLMLCLTAFLVGCVDDTTASSVPSQVGGDDNEAAAKKADDEAATNKSLPEEITNSIGMKLTLILAGEFLMGSPADEADRSDDEGPQHRVQITKPFYMGVTEVTQGQWFSVMSTKPWSGKEYVQEGDDYPAVYVSWEDVVAYCEKLSTKETKLYRLPTEAEWEYACRGGTTTAYSFATAYSFGSSTESLKDYEWFDENAWVPDDKYAHLVGTKKANPFGLNDMHGNVSEWCSDWYGSDYYGSSPASDPPGATTGSDRVYRGGSWASSAWDCRSAYRFRLAPSDRGHDGGFRLALTPYGK